MTTNELIFFVNGKKVVEKNVDPEWTLLYYLRNKLRLCGTKLGCAEGGCGACTVMVSKFDRKQEKIIHLAINACLAPICSMHGLAVTTVEGIGSTKTRLHPVQERIAKAHGSQCGFCTPGIVMSMYTLLRNSTHPTMDDMMTTFQGNLCRCTGYRPIIEGYKTFTEDWEKMQIGNGVPNGNKTCPMGDQCCKSKNYQPNNDDDDEALFHKSEFAPYDPTQEPIFPPELKLSDELDHQNLHFSGKNVEWFRPTNLDDLLSLKSKFPGAKIVVGNTEVGVEVKFKRFSYPTLINPAKILEMTRVDVEDNGVKIGAAATLRDVEIALKELIRTMGEERTRIFAAIVDMFRWFGGKQIRNVATIGGNIMTGSPISDLNPIFMAAKVVLTLQSQKGPRRVEMDGNFYTAYRKNIVEPEEVLTSIFVPYTSKNQYFYAYKQARRREDDISIVNAAFNVFFGSNSDVIEDVYMAFGGMAPTTVMVPETMKKLIGCPWNEATLERAYRFLIDELPLVPNAPGGMSQYRRSLTISFFFRAFLAICQKLQVTLPHVKINPKDLSGVGGFEPKILKSSQYFQVVPETQEKTDTVGRPIVHASAYKQATGEAQYCDDIPFFEGELYLAFVYSTKAHAKLISMDPAEALKMDGVHAFFSAKDLNKHQNAVGAVCQDEEIFISETVTSHGQILGAVVADDQFIAQTAARKVNVVYEDLTPVILTIEDAIKHNSFHSEKPMEISLGDVDKVFKEASHVIEGECRTGGQEHFYLETQCTVAVPKKEDNEMEIYCASQHPAEITMFVARMLEIPQNKVVTKVKRLGGGFGGKQSRPINVAAPVALAASRLNRPVRIMLDRDEDMVMTGGRNPFYSKYKAAFDDDGKILACDILIYNNAGYSKDLSMHIMEKACVFFENAYKVPNVRVKGIVCKTNVHSHTAFRAFGAPQGMFIGENIIRDVAEYLGKDVVEVGELNLYREGDTTHYNQTLEHCTLRRCWSECLESSNYAERKKIVDEFNSENRWKKRGISVVPTKYGISFEVPFLNQAGALVLVYTDGSVLLSHGGTEMGQGLHTKMIQVASKVLEIPTSIIHISETSTDKVPNASPTAASTGSDLNGMAVMRACETIKERLAPFKAKNPKGRWEDWVNSAYFDRVSLSATGFYATPDLNYDWSTNSGRLFNYFTYGVACTEVEVDCLTGDHEVLRTDIVMDIGESLNPAIDIGQIEGAFMQGYGMFLLEEMVYLSDGSVFTKGPGSYKIPGFSDIPGEFNVSLLKGAPNPRAVYSSKAVGEPPLFLASSVLFAAREAIKSARIDAGIPAPFTLNAPATAEKLRMSCQDHLTSKIEEPTPGSFTPWNVIL